MRGHRRASLKDIARNLGLSVNTVSRAMSGKDGVSAETRERVQAEAQRLAYVPNTFARSLVRGSSRMISLLIANPANPFYADVVHAIEERCRQLGYTLLLQITNETEEDERRAADSLLWSAADGALVVSTQHTRDHLERLRYAIPLVLINRDVPDLESDFVGVDNERALDELTTHVLSAGASSVVLLEDDLRLSTITSRLAGLRAAVARTPGATWEVAPVPTPRSGRSPLPDEARAVVRAVVDRPQRPDAIIAGTDYYALAAYEALDDAGLAVPDDVLVAGVGDYPFAPYLRPSLTSVRLPAQEIGTWAVDALVERITGSTAPPRSRLLPPVLVERGSTGLSTGGGGDEQTG